MSYETSLQDAIHQCDRYLESCQKVLLKVEDKHTEVVQQPRRNQGVAHSFGRGSSFQELQLYDEVCDSSIMTLRTVFDAHKVDLQSRKEAMSLKKEGLEITYKQCMIEGGVH